MIDLDHFILPETPSIEDYVVATYLLRRHLKDPEDIIKDMLQVRMVHMVRKGHGTITYDLGPPGQLRGEKHAVTE